MGLINGTTERLGVWQQEKEQDRIATAVLPTISTTATSTVALTLTATAVPPTTSAATPEPTDTPTSTPIPTFTPIPTLTATPMPTQTPKPTSTPIPTRTPRPTTTTPPTPTQIPGRAELYKPIYPPNHMAAVHWNWRNGYDGFQSIDFDFTIHNDFDTHNLYPNHGLYLMLDSSDISGTGYYFGIQAGLRVGRGLGKGCIFSRWGTRDLSNVRVAEDGWSESAGYEGDFVSVRKAYHWSAGDYRARIATDEEDDEGRWFGLWFTDKSTGETTWCGSLRFPYSNGKASLNVIHGSVVEIFGGPRGIKPIDIPEWQVTMHPPVADSRSEPTEVHISYENWDGGPSVPNSNIIPDLETGTIHIHVGRATERTTEEGWVGLNK